VPRAQQSLPAPDVALYKAKADSINTAFMRAVADRDTNAVAAFYAGDARFMPPNAPAAVGHDAIRGMWAQFLAAPGMSLQLQSTEVMVAQAADMVVDIGTYRLTVTGPNNQPMEDVGKYVVVLRPVNGEWKIVVDTFNSDRSPAQT
jgi:uncharacterized protein (TIGR02246 family)